MGVLWQLVVSRRYGRSRCAPEQKKRDWTRKTLVRRGNPRGAVPLAEVWFLFLFHSNFKVVPVFIDLLCSTWGSLDGIG